jgi:steroid delta-isomerase-like uncharacterized protein
MSCGRVVSIHIAPAATAPMQSVKSVRAIAGQGLEGDRYFAKQGTFSATVGPSGEATLIESETVDALNAKLGTAFSPGEMRRNIVTRGAALNHLVGHDFRVGDALLRGLRLCEPCAHLEKLTREGVIAETMHRCGLRAQILAGGTIRPGDPITLLNDPLEENENLIRRYYDEMWNPWNFSKANDLLDEKIAFRGSLGTETEGREAFCGYMRQVQSAFPDFHNTIEELSTESDRAVARLTYRGTHRGEIFGVVPTGKAITYSGAAFFRIANGKIAEGWVLGDLLSLLRQLGAHSLP